MIQHACAIFYWLNLCVVSLLTKVVDCTSVGLTSLPIANYCSLSSCLFGQTLNKLQGKVVTHSEEVGWWRTLMVECVTLA